VEEVGQRGERGGGERPAAGWAKKVGWPAGLIRKKIERF
jgi:hypothetical protein